MTDEVIKDCINQSPSLSVSKDLKATASPSAIIFFCSALDYLDIISSSLLLLLSSSSSSTPP